MNRRARAVVIVGVLALSGCAPSIDVSDAVRVDDGAPATIPVAEIAALAEGIILDEFEAEFDLVCNAEEVPFQVGTVVNCLGTEAESGEQVPLLIEIVLIEGDLYEINITVDDPAEPGAESGFVSSSDFQEVVASALEQAIGERGAVNCGPDDVEIFIGAELVCTVVLSSGFAETAVRVIAFDGSTYEIEAELLE